MSLWVVRAGKYGEQEETAIKNSLVCHGWNELPDYFALTKDELREVYREKYPRDTEKQIISRLGQVWRFAHEIQEGDLVALPLKSQSAFEFGRITGDYQYKEVAPNVKHIRRVEWLRNGTVQRSLVPEDILFSMNSALTVFRVDRNEAEKRVDNILAFGPASFELSVEEVEAEIPDLAEDAMDLERTAGDEILKFIQAKFKGHGLARLVAAVLRAQGYKTKESPPGPDGGVDILAGSGPLGFDHPRLCVQVKSGATAEGRTTFDQILGVMSKYHCEHGLLVSWGGFTKPTITDARNDFFKVRLWDQGDIVREVLKAYESLDPEIKADLPLKRIWVMANEETDESDAG